MIRSGAVVFVVLAGAFVAFAATRPDTFRVQRTARIAAPPEKIFPFVEDLRRWDGWSPWEKLDPTMKRTYGGAPRGKGAVYEWQGNGEVGQGRMEITDTMPPSRVTIALHFIKPIEGRSVAEFTLEPRDGATQVTWAMQGHNRFVGKVMGIFIDMDRMIGKNFETGLAGLKTLAEQAS